MKISILRWFFSLIGVQLVGAVVWFVGPLWPVLDDWQVRAGIIGALVLVWLLGNVLLDWLRGRRDRRLTRGVTGGAAGRAESEALQDKLAVAMEMLRSAKGKRGYLYEQPWYAIIGPPGAGKTTALLNAGLKFPLAEEMGRGAVAGVGGTRLCEWWFTEGAVLIDTAGRYTTQDSDTAVDRAGWNTFLGMLKATRPKQPLNGVLVAIALNDVVADASEARLAHARAIRRRIKELETRLGLYMPVYAIFTKVDLLAGFSEFFDDLDREQRSQVWGMTFPLLRGAKARAASALKKFAEEFRNLAERLDRRMFDRLQNENLLDRRALVAAFPTQFGSIAQPVQDFLTEAFGPKPNDPAPMLRGVYFTSATQEGTPIDRLTGTIARAFGLDQRRAARLRPEDGRSYFLGGLLRDVVFREAMLVSERPGSVRRRMLFRSMGFVVCLLVALAGAGALWIERGRNQADIDRTQAALAAFEKQETALPLNPVQDSDLAQLTPWLDQAANLPYRTQDRAVPGFLGLGASLGLGQEAKLAAGSQAVYRHALEFALFPRLVWRLEAQMRGNLARPDFMYEATRVYLMLGGLGPLDRDLLREWVTFDWEDTYPGPDNATLRQSLRRHLDALLDGELPSISLDGDLVANARSTFSRVSLAQRLYSRIKPSAAAQRLKPWLPSEALGAAGVKVFIRTSGKPLTEGVPGFYTVDGFYKVLLPGLARAGQEVASESWVLGQKANLDPNGTQLRAAEREVIGQYLAEYAQVWDAMLADLDVAPLRSLVQAAQDLFILSSPNSPMKDLLTSIGRQVTLAAAAPPAPAPSAAAPGNDRSSRLEQLLGRQNGTDAAGPQPGQEIDDRYKALRALSGAGGATSFDQVIKPMVDLQQQLAKMAASNRAGPDTGGPDPAAALRGEALRQPEPLRRWMTEIAASGAALRSGGAKQQVVSAYNAATGPGPVCAGTIKDKYPFVPGATADVSLEDFGKLFAPSGVLDAFFNTQLKPYVDTTSKPWKPATVDGVTAPVTAADLAQFQRAALIRDMFFRGSGSMPQVRFDVTPGTADPASTGVVLDLGGGTSVPIASGTPPRPASVTWPPPRGAAGSAPPGASVTWTPAASGVLQESGPWAMFRLFTRARLQPAGTDRVTLVFQNGDRQANFELRASPSPFGASVLQDFRCPAVQ